LVQAPFLACQDLPRLLTLQLCLSRLLRILPVQALALQQALRLPPPAPSQRHRGK